MLSEKIFLADFLD